MGVAGMMFDVTTSVGTASGSRPGCAPAREITAHTRLDATATVATHAATGGHGRLFTPPMMPSTARNTPRTVSVVTRILIGLP